MCGCFRPLLDRVVKAATLSDTIHQRRTSLDSALLRDKGNYAGPTPARSAADIDRALSVGYAGVQPPSGQFGANQWRSTCVPTL
jgi:hypothetical protein